MTKVAYPFIKNFEDFMNRDIEHHILWYDNKLRFTYDVAAYPDGDVISFADGYTIEKMAEDIRQNSHLFRLMITNEFYYPNTNMQSRSNAQNGLKGFRLVKRS